jgi:holo-[acyl-carrier protein] synthase
MVVGIGIDLFEVARMERQLRGRDPGLREELFTPAEIEGCEAARDPMFHYAACFAAKEAVYKALAPPPGAGVAWRDVEVRIDGRRGAVSLRGAMRERAETLGVCGVWLRLSRTRRLAMANVVLDG